MKRRFGLFTTLETSNEHPGILFLRFGGAVWRWLGMTLLGLGIVGIGAAAMGSGKHGLGGLVAALVGSILTLPWQTIEFRIPRAEVVLRLGLFLPLVGEFWTSEERFSLSAYTRAAVDKRPDLLDPGAQRPSLGSTSWTTYLEGREKGKNLEIAKFPLRRSADALALALNEALGFPTVPISLAHSPSSPQARREA